MGSDDEAAETADADLNVPKSFAAGVPPKDESQDAADETDAVLLLLIGASQSNGTALTGADAVRVT